MNYELKNAVAQGAPYDKTDNTVEPPVITYGINVLIKTGIVGQTYNGFQNMDLGFCPLEKTWTIDQCTTEMQVYATNFVSTKYPNN